MGTLVCSLSSIPKQTHPTCSRLCAEQKKKMRRWDGCTYRTRRQFDLTQVTQEVGHDTGIPLCVVLLCIEGRVLFDAVEASRTADQGCVQTWCWCRSNRRKTNKSRCTPLFVYRAVRATGLPHRAQAPWVALMGVGVAMQTGR